MLVQTLTYIFDIFVIGELKMRINFAYYFGTRIYIGFDNETFKIIKHKKIIESTFFKFLQYREFLYFNHIYIVMPVRFYVCVSF